MRKEMCVVPVSAKSLNRRPVRSQLPLGADYAALMLRPRVLTLTCVRRREGVTFALMP